MSHNSECELVNPSDKEYNVYGGVCLILSFLLMGANVFICLLGWQFLVKGKNYKAWLSTVFYVLAILLTTLRII